MSRMTATPTIRRTKPLPELELEVMKILWSLGDGTVADVQEVLNAKPPA